MQAICHPGVASCIHHNIHFQVHHNIPFEVGKCFARLTATPIGTGSNTLQEIQGTISLKLLYAPPKHSRILKDFIKRFRLDKLELVITLQLMTANYYLIYRSIFGKGTMNWKITWKYYTDNRKKKNNLATETIPTTASKTRMLFWWKTHKTGRTFKYSGLALFKGRKY